MNNPLDELLEEYGKPRVRYSGTGELTNDTHVVPVEWSAAQYDDGQILLACQGGPELFAFVIGPGPERFTGHNADGVNFSCDGWVGELPILRDLPHDATGGWAVYHSINLDVHFPDHGPTSLLRYLLTNFEFDRDCQQGINLNLPGIEGAVHLAPLEDDPLAQQRLRALRVARPTAWLEIPPQTNDPEAAQVIANDICSLLSLARGTKITWVQEEEIDGEGQRARVSHSHSVTKPYSPFAPIDRRFIRNTANFVESTYPVYRERRDIYRLNRGTIDAVLDAKIETDYLETRGAKLAIALEALKQNVLVAIEPDVQFYTPPEEFSSAVQELASTLKNALIAVGISSATADAMAMPDRLRALNRRSFANLLKRVCKRIDLKLPNQDLQLFVRCRNSLVHQGNFYCAAASQTERVEVAPKSTKFEEYIFLISVVDAFLLRLVGYRGPYLVRTAASDWEERNV